MNPPSNPWRDFKVETWLVVRAATLREAAEAVTRSGLKVGEVIGEALIVGVDVHGQEE